MKRRNQLAALANYHRKMLRTCTHVPIPEVKPFHPTMTENVTTFPDEVGCSLVESRKSNDTDVIEDSEDENISQRGNIRRLVISNSSGEDNIATSTITFPRSHTYFGNEHQASPLKTDNGISNPNKKIHILSDVVIKDSRNAEISTISETRKYNTVATTDVAASCTAAAPSDAKEICNENRDVTTYGSLQQSPNSQAAEPFGAKASVSGICKENFDATTYGSLQQSQNLAVAEPFGAEASVSGICKENSDAFTYGYQLQSSCKQVPVPSDAKRAIEFKTRKQNSNSDVKNISLFEDHTVETTMDVIICTEIHRTTLDGAPNHTEIDKWTKSGKRKRNKTVKKSFIDFLSDEEKLDFSSGSSDNWSCKESDSSSGEEHFTNKMKKKRVKKRACVIFGENEQIRKKEKSINKRKTTKTLKDAGKNYENKSGKLVPEKK
ncbi:unnamed protein product [Parnassius apollo]|uniref:(apollo) hypothetical protein n=1 Tax=Parnassius apollo TaxID=110799 RepID=A0A8S3X3N8_PARAO|nr:unnamed protein product [Parnassius apollo]